MTNKTIKINATDQSLGRLATQVSISLRGKHLPEYNPSRDLGCSVVVENARDMRFTGQKLDKKIYYRHSGYPGGLKERTLREMLEKKGYGEVLRLAVWNMLPKNKLRAKMIKRLIVKQ